MFGLAYCSWPGMDGKCWSGRASTDRRKAGRGQRGGCMPYALRRAPCALRNARYRDPAAGLRACGSVRGCSPGQVQASQGQGRSIAAWPRWSAERRAQSMRGLNPAPLCGWSGRCAEARATSAGAPFTICDLRASSFAALTLTDVICHCVPSGMTCDGATARLQRSVFDSRTQRVEKLPQANGSAGSAAPPWPPWCSDAGYPI